MNRVKPTGLMLSPTYHLYKPVWLIIGLSAAGKSTLANKLARRCNLILLDADKERKRWPKLGFSKIDRIRNLRKLASRAAAFPKHAVIVVAIAPQNASRKSFIDRLKPRPVNILFINTPLNVCQSRDPRGLYAKASTGVINELPGINIQYNSPTRKSAIYLNGQSTKLSLSTKAEKIINNSIFVDKKDRR